MEVQVLNQFELPLKSGNYVRLIGLQGVAEGKAFFFKERITLGRGRNCGVVLADKQCSREHAEITIIGKQIIITDLKSQNGIFVNEIKVRQHPLKENDKILIGNNIFKFNLVHIDDEVDEIHPSQEASKQNNRKSLLPIILILAGLFFLLTDDGENTQSKGTLRKNDFFNREINTKERKLNPEQKQKLDIIFQRGKRELREGNYFRAIEEFNLALIINPKDPAAAFYLKKTNDALKKEIESMFFKGLRDFESLKYKSAISSYCAIIRLLNKYPDDDRYKRAEKKITEIEEKLGKEKDEIKCL